MGLRIFEDDDGKMNRDVIEVGGGVLIVSQFTLYGDCRKGRRPSFIEAAPPAIAVPLYAAFVDAMRARGVPTATGRFGAMMQVELVNEGPVTLILDSMTRRWFVVRQFIAAGLLTWGLDFLPAGRFIISRRMQISCDSHRGC